ncbi:MAG: ABC transporter substrate-binding protein [Oscillospiraceae bacterium]
MSKNRIISSVLAVIAIVGICAGCGAKKPVSDVPSPSPVAEAKGFTINYAIEDKNYDISYDSVPKRAVSLSSFTTEMMLALGLEANMVGTAYQDNEVLHEFKTAYESIKSLSKANVSREQMVDTAPDFLTGWLSDFKEKNHNPQFCVENGIKMYVPQCEYPNTTVETVYRDFENLGKIFKVEARAAKVIDYMKAEIKKVQDSLPANFNPKSVFIYESGSDAPYTPITALPNDIVTLAGGKNIFGDGEKSWSSVTWEEVVALNPEYIVIMKYDEHDDFAEKMQILKNNAALADITAIKEGNIVEIAAADLLPGVRNARAVAQLKEAFWGKAAA